MCQRSNAAATDHPTILLNHPIGGARLAVEFKQLIEVGVGYGVALISRQPVFRRNLADNVGDSSIVFSGDAAQVDEAALADTEWLKQAIVAVRNIRAEMNIAPGKPLELLLRGCSADAQRRVTDNQSFLQSMARLESIIVLPADDKGPVSVTKIIDGAELLIPMAGLINKEDELARLAKEVAKIDGEISRIESKLANEGFVARAPEAVIAKEREKLDGYAEAKSKLIEQQAVIAAL